MAPPSDSSAAGAQAPQASQAPPPRKPKKFLNDPSNAVSEYIAGQLLQYPNRLRKLANNNVLLSSDVDNLKRVSLLSGGGCGHEPAHAGYVGRGMLTGAVLGGIFASPSASSVLSAIRAVTSPTAEGGMGCLLIVKNYTGDRLNFGAAAELALAEGRMVKMVVVADDCAVPRSKGITGARGVAGAVLVHKFAGAAAESNKTLDDVKAVAEVVASSVGTLGVALDAVTVPGAQLVNDRLDHPFPNGSIEIGMGIHGEAGIKKTQIMSCDEIAGEMLTAIQSYGKMRYKNTNSKKQVVGPLYFPGDDLLVLVNNLGGTSNFEISILANALVKKLEGPISKCRVTRLYVGSYMTSFDMKGASVSILPATKETKILGLMDYLDAPTGAPAWTKGDVWIGTGAGRPSLAELPEVPGPGGMEDGSSSPTPPHLPPLAIPDFASLARSALNAACRALLEAEPLLTKYDTVVGDGDCGITMARGAAEVLKRIDSGDVRLDHPSSTFADLANAASASMGGTSGALIEILFRKAGTVLLASPSARVDRQEGGDDGISPRDLAEAFAAGVGAVSFYGGASEGSRTMLDALCPASSAMMAASAKGGIDIAAAAKAARKGVDATANMGSAEAGRSNYVSEDVLLGTPDPGALAVAVVLEAVAKAISSS